MSRTALALAGVFLALGALVWLLAVSREPPEVPDETPTSPEPAAAPAALGGTVQAPPVRAPAPTGTPPRVSTRDELARVLNARGLDAEKLIAGYHNWRIAHGFLGADPLAGITADNAPSQIYAAMDRSTQKDLADSGDLGAIQAYAAGSLPDDPFAALKYYSSASELGSAAAMAEIASILADLGNLQPGTGQNDRPFADKLLALRGGNPARDLRQDAAAWTLASIRQYGPVVATPANMELVQELGSNPDRMITAAICGQSLAILASLSAATAGTNAATLPPVFVTEKGLYDRLPCGDTPAPVTPPRVLETCTSSPATGNNNQPIELWICPEN
jgi:hypothetical protein